MPAASELSRKLIFAARAVGRRIILSRGWADLKLIDGEPDCIAVDDISHDLLFPRVAAVVHHGGAGTTAAAARAGVPQVITPMFSDQFYWAGRIVDLGVGATTSNATMTEESLSDALRNVLDPAVAVRAHTLSQKISPNGAEIAARRLGIQYGAAAD
jgi:vancomycin aglycone glucosyltransferase